MIKALIIEDEVIGQNLIKRLLETHFANELTVCGIADSVNKSLKTISDSQPDLVFLDVQIKGGSGFDVLSELKTWNFEVIFTTAYNNYAIKAIKTEALDYLLKPINTNEFLSAVGKAITKITEKKQAQVLEDTPQKDKFLLTNYNETEFIDYSDILFFEANGNYTYCHLVSGKKTISKSIGEIEKQLNEEKFMRTHHSFIVNLSKIEKFNKGRSGVLFLYGGAAIPVSQRKMKDFSGLLYNRF
jgi:two-component system, LytTR family, response regulator